METSRPESHLPPKERLSVNLSMGETEGSTVARLSIRPSLEQLSRPSQPPMCEGSILFSCRSSRNPDAFYDDGIAIIDKAIEQGTIPSECRDQLVESLRMSLVRVLGLNNPTPQGLDTYLKENSIGSKRF